MDEQLKASITNLLQEYKRGLSVDQLKAKLGISRDRTVLIELHELVKEGTVVPADAVWKSNLTP